MTRPRPAAPPRRQRRRPVVALLALASAATLTAGVLAALGLDRDRDTGRATADPTAPAQRSGTVTNVVDTTQLAPLKRVVPPDVLVVGASSLTAAEVRKVSRLRGVQDVALVAGGAVQLQNRLVNTFAVDPSTFRSWTPPATARKTELWEALAADKFVASDKAVRELKLHQGLRYPVVAKTIPTMTMGGSGDFGLPGIDMLVSRKMGEQLGLIPNLALLVNAPGADPAALTRAMDRIFRGGAKVVNLNEPQYRQAVSYLELYRRAATTCPGLSWTVLAAIGQVESNHGRNNGPSSAGALGPMQFLPSTWKAYGVDGDGDGKADIMNPYDAIPAAAKYLCAHGAGRGGRSLYQAIYAYNHAHWYVQKVLALAKAYAARYR
ncbi:lytic transglycosylase domain-containing protein [Thermomonospora curvata]|uniref:Lytic transglycosylase catalytic n=1 Tax=Thermomonospora curvata (strain ATCC 19995 / DSM 43183 / JCM 3096 / KCTC 9072 / NBRC 15933 / NCIMB 10081 / Henssen B9) TaxID=471852 RepID=D1ABZ9_THECD|nr:lytic transglycosylase domain-containing protein [Thermomonospora curvata]ACY97265.1 Lytic transglycosylase catalytic [Thermomonospora curvata DSM 43183]